MKALIAIAATAYAIGLWMFAPRTIWERELETAKRNQQTRYSPNTDTGNRTGNKRPTGNNTGNDTRNSPNTRYQTDRTRYNLDRTRYYPDRTRYSPNTGTAKPRNLYHNATPRIS